MDSPITCREHVPPDGGRVQSMRYSWSEPLLETKSWKQWKCPLQPPAELSVAYLLRFFSASSVPGELCHYVFQPFHLCVFELPTIRYLEVCTGCLHRLKTALCRLIRMQTQPWYHKTSVRSLTVTARVDVAEPIQRRLSHFYSLENKTIGDSPVPNWVTSR